MSILIKGMKMPETCEECAYQTKGACFASGVNKGTITIRRMDKDRPDWCPLVELPSKHGDLIDRKALEDSVLKWLPPDPCGCEEKERPFETDICVSLMMEIEEQPTVIEAEDE